MRMKGPELSVPRCNNGIGISDLMGVSVGCSLRGDSISRGSNGEYKKKKMFFRRCG